jgi:hypothetical protein
MSNLWMPKSDFIKPGNKMVDYKHPLAVGLKVCVLMHGQDSIEVCSGKLPSYKGSLVHATHATAPAGELHDVHTYSGSLPISNLPHGQCISMIGTPPDGSQRIEFPIWDQLATFLDINKPWSMLTRFRVHPYYGPGGSVWSWGVYPPNYSGCELAIFGNQTAPYLSSMFFYIINNDGTVSKRFDAPLNYIAPMDTTTVGLVWNGKPTAAPGVSELTVYMNNNLTPMTTISNGTLVGNSLAPKPTALSLYARADATHTSWGERNFVLFWDRMLTQYEFKQIDISGFPFLV